MRILDLGYGTGSSTIAWHQDGHTVIGVDWDDLHKATIIGDYFSPPTWVKIRELGPYDFVHASPECRLYTLMGSLPWEYRHGKIYPSTEEASVEMDNLHYLVRQIQELKPRLGYVIENPVGMMCKMPVMQRLHQVKISLCQYGDDRMKPTHLMGDIPASFRPLFCRNGSPCHVPAPRGSRTGTQGR